MGTAASAAERMTIGITIDVPDVAAGISFYGVVFGMDEIARPLPIYAIIGNDHGRIGLMEKAPGSRPTPTEGPVRAYARHWTPVHLDFHVDDYAGTLDRLRSAGGTVEAEHTRPGRPPVAFCADPFGHGLCILGPR
jgi:predicted enzyme related to lactoylglutathione lyase